MSLSGNAHLVAGGVEQLPTVLSLIEKEGIPIEGNPDVYIRTYTHFGIDEARELRDRATTKAISGSRRAFVIATPGMTNDAQNALLKTLEEPPGDALFIFIVPSPEMFLPTLRSRTQILQLAPESQFSIIDVKLFLAATPQKRLDMLKPLMEKDTNERRDMSGIIAFLSSLERAVHSHPESLRPIYTARKYIGDKGALVKPLLEQVALLVPVVR